MIDINGRGKPAKGFRMTKQRQQLLDQGFTMDQILANKLNPNMIPAGVVSPAKIEHIEELSDKEILDRQIAFFETLEKTAIGVSNGAAKSLLISGSAGIGKSYGIENSIGQNENNGFISGHVTPMGLYQTLYNFRFKNCTIIFDDSDNIFNEEKSLGMLKHALDLKQKRRIEWRSKTEILDENGETIPNSFIFEAGIVFISNMNLSAIVSQRNKLSPHIEAIISRSLYIDAFTIFKSSRDYLIRIDYLKQTIFDSAGIGLDAQKTISDFITNHAETMRELSLRLVSKLVAVYKIHGPEDFENAAKMLVTKMK